MHETFIIPPGSLFQVIELSKHEVQQKEEIARLSELYDESREQIENLEFMLLEAQNTADIEKVGRRTNRKIYRVTVCVLWHHYRKLKIS